MAQLTKANEAGTTDLRAQGTLLQIHGFTLRESAGVATHVAGTGSGYVTNGTQAKGATTITVQSGTGTIVAGDVISFAGDPDKYVVTTALSAGSLVIGSPGLRASVPGNAAVTLAQAYTGNLAFARSAIVLATRAPALPAEGDLGDDRELVFDKRTGLTFEVASVQAVPSGPLRGLHRLWLGLHQARAYRDSDGMTIRSGKDCGHGSHRSTTVRYPALGRVPVAGR